MEGVYFKDGVYVLIDIDNKNDICIYNHNIHIINLYGGRVKLTTLYPDKTFLDIDGHSIVEILYSKINNRLSIQSIVAHLNAIESNGIESFMGNYKKNIEFLYNELKEIDQKLDSQLTIEKDELKVKGILLELAKMRELLFLVLAILFNLRTHMSAALENEKVMTICQTVIDSLAQYD